MNTPPPRPYILSFAAFITSSSLWNFSTTTTGPKISSCAILISFVTSAKIVGLTKNPFLRSPSSILVPPVTKRAPSFFPIST